MLFLPNNAAKVVFFCYSAKSAVLLQCLIFIISVYSNQPMHNKTSFARSFLRYLRLCIATFTFVCITLLFLGVSWSFTMRIGWLAKIQFLPALLAFNIGVLAMLVMLTMLFGRIYCSVVCPLGIMQDIFGWLGKKAKKNRYTYSEEKRWLRYGILAVFVICLILGFAPVTTLLAPYSAYGRIINSLFRPLYDLLINALAYWERNADTYRFQAVDIWMRSVTTFIVAWLTLGVLGFLAWRNGRTYCNTVCPVGTILSFFSRFSLFRIQFDADKCKQCSLCEKNCKASAIDYKNHKVDYSRCVTCGDCTDQCRFDALHYRMVRPQSSQPQEQVDTHRRAFLVGTAVASAAALTSQAQMKVDGGVAVIEDKVPPQRETPVTPPGSVSHRNMERHCTACQLCVSACPNNVLRPSTDPLHLMQPVMSFERGYCRPECTRCSEVCPTGAIRRISREEKTAVHVGHAVWVADNCIPVANGDSCGNCARHCPAWSIHMTDYQTADGRTVQVPVVDAEKCIGCGACENLCPARPFSAIYVEGNTMHHIN